MGHEHCSHSASKSFVPCSVARIEDFSVRAPSGVDVTRTPARCVCDAETVAGAGSRTVLNISAPTAICHFGTTAYFFQPTPFTKCAALLTTRIYLFEFDVCL